MFASTPVSGLRSSLDTVGNALQAGMATIRGYDKTSSTLMGSHLYNGQSFQRNARKHRHRQRVDSNSKENKARSAVYYQANGLNLRESGFKEVAGLPNQNLSASGYAADHVIRVFQRWMDERDMDQDLLHQHSTYAITIVMNAVKRPVRYDA